MDEEDIVSQNSADDADDNDDGSGDDRTDSEDLDDDASAVEFDMGVRIGNLDRAALADLPPWEQLETWHNTLLPVEVDLIKELDGTSLFFVHAESLIVDLIMSKEVPFAEDSQFLRLTYCIEHMLNGLKGSGGVFRLVFFDNSKQLTDAVFPDSVWAFRQAFLLHCKAVGIDHVVFPHWYSQDFADHVKEWRPSFFLVADDVIDIEDADEEEDEEEDKDATKKIRGFFQALVLRCLSYKTHVALLRGMQRRGNAVMTFAVFSDTYDAFIDVKVKECFTQFFEDNEDEEDGDETPDQLVKSLQEYAKADNKVKQDDVLRSFLTKRFVENTLKAVAKADGATLQLMQLVVKVLILHEVMLRKIPLDKRAFNACVGEDWVVYSEQIGNAMDNFFQQMAQDIAKLRQGSIEGLPIDACDLFDGRMYRHLFFLVCERGLETEAGGKVDKKFFGFTEDVCAEIERFWKQAGGAKDGFFPLAFTEVAKVKGIAPPELPDKEEPRAKPKISTIESDLLDKMYKDREFKSVDVVDGQDVSDQGNLWTKYGWNTNATFFDMVKREEEMEKNEFDKKMEEKFRLKAAAAGKTNMSARDEAYMKTLKMKQRQLALRALHSYSKSLTDSHGMHPPIVMTDQERELQQQGDKSGKKKEEEVAKVSKKQQEILDKRAAEDEAKVKEADKNMTKKWEPDVEKLAEITDLAKLETDVLDLLCGFQRITDSFVGFPALSKAFKTDEAQAKIILKVVKSVRAALKKLQLDKLWASQPQVRRMVVYLYCIIQETTRSYGKRDLIDGKGIKLLQETLIGIGFPQTAESIYDAWRQNQEELAKAAAKAEGGDKGKKADDKDDKKGKKDDKKDKKDDKKDKKDDKKDKKDDKKDKKDKDDDKGGKDGDLDAFRVSKTDKGVDKLWSGVEDDEYAFQLMHMGRYMTRTVGTKKDPLNRVYFKPDAWQKELLDIVDDGRSSLIVAPTASGKTFIGYYTMDKVLRQDHDGVCVYVAPSKALVNQVSAEIYARFGSGTSCKTYPANCASQLLGVFIREYNSADGVMEAGKWKNCQILVTIPHILEMLLLSHSHQDWVKRLKYVVFDEVHCIGEQDGALWEHCMQLIPCPFLALSATVADESFFHNWLKSVNAKKKHSDVELVIHKERWNDLYKFVWDGKANTLRPLHPFTCLTEQEVRLQGLAADISLTPQEMGQLFVAVKQVIGPHKAWDQLAPVTYFGKKKFGFISKLDARTYEKALKECFLELLKDNILTTEGFTALTTQFLNSKLELASRIKDDKAGNDADDDQADEGMQIQKMTKGSSYLKAATLMNVVKSLDQVQCLPALFFNFDRKEIEKMLRVLVTELKDQQHFKYYGDEDKQYKSKKIMEKRWADYEAKKVLYEQALKMKASKGQEAKAGRANKDDEGRGADTKEKADATDADLLPEPVEPIDLADEIDPQFTFHSVKALGQWAEDIEEQIKKLKKKNTPQYLIDGLRRGIGMHHEGCKNDYKRTVEILFRRGYLRVVIAGKSLGLGINMPCRTTIFCGDSLELNGLNYRQMSGRAGRRGFDLLGQVVFLDMAFLKVQRLVTSDLSKLTGEFVQSPTTILRAMQTWEKVTDDEMSGKNVPRSKKEIARCLAPMFSLPFFHSDTAQLETQVVYTTRFLIEFLQKIGNLNAKGYCKSLSNMVTHLFEIEPANLILTQLLVSGSLHRYLEQEKELERKNDRKTHLTVKLVSVLGWLFLQKRLPANIPKERNTRKKHMPSASSPMLPPLPTAIQREVKAYNSLVLEHYQQLAWTVTTNIGKIEARPEIDLVLPLSRRQFAGGSFNEAMPNPFADGSVFASSYIKHIFKYRARSPFSAVAGLGDNFSTSFDLAKNVRNVMHLDLNQLPSAAADSFCADQLEATNSWVLDFMMHGKKKYLLEDNGIPVSTAYQLISDFKDSVKRTVEVMKNYKMGDDDIVIQTFIALAEEMEKYLKMDH